MLPAFRNKTMCGTIKVRKTGTQVAITSGSSTVVTWKHARRLVVLVFGVTLLALGVALLVLPGPAMVVIPFALMILGTEFVWARRLLRRVKDSAMRMAESARSGPTAQDRNAPRNS